MNIVWVLVCDAARARLFEVQNDGPEWRAVDTFEHAASRSKTSELVADHSGQRSSEGRSVHQNALAPASLPKEVEKAHFAHSLATMLDQALRSNRFGRWVLVAPPHFLGMLKNEITVELQKHLLATVDKDFIQLEVPDLVERLKQVVQIPAEQRDTVRPSQRARAGSVVPELPAHGRRGPGRSLSGAHRTRFITGR